MRGGLERGREGGLGEGSRKGKEVGEPVRGEREEESKVRFSKS